MISPPKGEHYLRAVWGGSLASVFIRAVKGPFAFQVRLSDLTGEDDFLDLIWWVVIPNFLLAYAVALVFLLPAYEVTLPPSKRYWVWEVLVPGTASVWGLARGVVTITWGYFLVQGFMFHKMGVPYLLWYTPNIGRSFGIPQEGVRPWSLLAYGMLDPWWIQLYALPAALLALNLVLVMRRKLKS
jgi:hypothetical protein